MKIVANILLWISLVVGVVAAATAYTPLLENIDTTQTPLTLADGAGRSASDETQPLVPEGTALTAEVIEMLRASDVTRVRVKEFALGRWDGFAYFVIASFGLLVAAGLIRMVAKSEVAKTMSSDRAATETPDHALAAAVEEVDMLRRDLESMTTDSERLHAIVHRIDGLRGGHLDAFVEARAELITRLGLAGFAQMMDRFAAAERQLNRAWSAAVDGVLAESLVCLETGETLLGEAHARLQAGPAPARDG